MIHRITLVSLLLCLLAFQCYAQNSYEQKEITRRDSLLCLSDMQASRDSFHIRINLPGEVLDIARTGNGNTAANESNTITYLPIGRNIKARE